VAPFVAGFVAGLALGLIVIGFLAIAAYERGVDEATAKRKYWRAELVARRAAAARTLAALPARRAS
jgi:TRAP-type C4-dicarboxylate transport system permease large subunit